MRPIAPAAAAAAVGATAAATAAASPDYAPSPAPRAAAPVAPPRRPGTVQPRRAQQTVTDYSYVKGDLQRIAILAGGLIVLLVGLSFFLR
jgi:hypothetical protein